MTSLIEDYVNRVDFDSYEDFHKNFKKISCILPKHHV